MLHSSKGYLVIGNFVSPFISLYPFGSVKPVHNGRTAIKNFILTRELLFFEMYTITKRLSDRLDAVQRYTQGKSVEQSNRWTATDPTSQKTVPSLRIAMGGH